MFTFGLIALLGMAQADTPKKKTDKTEESKTTKKSSDSKSSSKTSSTKKVTKPAPKKTTTKAPSTSKSTSTKAVPKKTPNKPPPKQSSQKSPPKPTGKTKTTASPAKQRAGQEQSRGNAHKPINLHSRTSNTNRPSYNRAPNNVERPQVGKEQSNTPNAHSPIGNKK